MELKDFETILASNLFENMIPIDTFKQLFDLAYEQEAHIKALQEELDEATKRNAGLKSKIADIAQILSLSTMDFPNEEEYINGVIHAVGKIVEYENQGFVVLPSEPIEAAVYLAKTVGNVSELHQIAEHLLVYCNAHEEDDEE